MTPTDRNARLAKRMLLAMAWDRKTFKSRLFWLLQGALEHYYRVQFAKLNGQTKWVQHWRTEVERMIGPDVLDVLWTQTKGRWDTSKAVDEVLVMLHQEEDQCRSRALAYVAKVFSIWKPLSLMPTDASCLFYVDLDANVTRYLSD